jgi:hypothetical protein
MIGSRQNLSAVTAIEKAGTSITTGDFNSLQTQQQEERTQY